MTPALSQFKRFDMRERIRQGIGLCPKIRRRARGSKPGQGLTVVASYLPWPLIEQFGSAGSVSRVPRASGVDWMVYFWSEAK